MMVITAGTELSEGMVARLLNTAMDATLTEAGVAGGAGVVANEVSPSLPPPHAASARVANQISIRELHMIFT
jgi:hypothetical protein